MPRLKIPYPLGGLVENVAFADQPPGTTQRSQNDRGLDPITGRIRGGQRSGSSKFCSVALGSGRVTRIDSTSFDSGGQTYTDVKTTDWSTAGPSRGDSKSAATDKLQNRYFLDGPGSIVKFNADGVKCWSIALSTEDKAHECHALCVDQETGFVFAGVSTGGKSTTARIFCYRQRDDNTTDKVWQIEPGGYCEQLRIYQNQLYALLNFPDRGRAYVRVYSSIQAGQDVSGSGGPEQINEWAVPYPATDEDVSVKDGSVLTSFNANAQRGLDPRSPGSTYSSTDFRLEDLDHFKDRLWSWHDSSDRSTLALSPRSTEAGDDGAEVVAWFDKGGHSRNWYANHAISDRQLVPATEAGPTYKPVGLNGMPSISFSGTLYLGNGATNPAGQSMVGQGASSTDRAFRSEQLTPLPTYKGSQFVWFCVIKAALDDNNRGLIAIPNGGNDANARQIAIGRRDDSNLPGSVPMAGSVSLRDPGARASDSGQSTPSAGGPSGPVGVNPGALSGSGVAVITWICDGGVHDGNSKNGLTGLSSRSVLRVNGHPVDRWQSAPLSTTDALTLGIGFLGPQYRFAGLVCEMVCLSDWYDQDGTQQRLVTCPTYPDSNWTTDGDSEVERIEGYLAHKWGLAHELPSGQAQWMTFVSGPADNETLTIDAITYRFKNTLAAANDVKIAGGGALIRTTAANLYRAINRIGEPGVDYDQRTEKHPTFLALAATEQGAAFRVAIKSISPYAAQTTLAASSGGAITWLASTTALTITGSGTAHGWYPHPFALRKTSHSRGGPPGVSTNTIAQTSPFWLLQSVYPGVAKWAANTGKLAWVATSGYVTTASSAVAGQERLSMTGLGGVGYGVRVNSQGEVYSVGPKQSAVSLPQAVTADLFDLRKLGDDGTAFNSTTGGTGDPWLKEIVQDSNSLESPICRMDVDGFDNVYVPFFYTVTAQPYTGVSAVGYRRASLAGVGVEFLRVDNLPGANQAYAVAVDLVRPDFPAADTIQHAEHLFIAAQADGNKLSAFQLSLLKKFITQGSPRKRVLVAIVGGSIVPFDSAGLLTAPTGGFTLDTTAQYVDSVGAFGEFFFTDGVGMFVFNPKKNTLLRYASKSSGSFLPHVKILSLWRGRLVGCNSAENPNDWFMCKQGDPYDCNISPFTLTEQTAVLGSDSRIGVCPDIINAFCPITDDLAIFGGDHTIQRMTGDPMRDGDFHLISDITGMAFGRSWSKDPEGNLYFFGSRGGIYRMGMGSPPVRISLNKIEDRLDSIDLGKNRIECAWSHAEDGLRVMVIPWGSATEQTESFFWERQTDSWHVDTYGRFDNFTVQPTCVHMSDGDAPDDRVLVFAGEDGFVRMVDRNATSDDGIEIDSDVMIGPITAGDLDNQYLFTDIDLVCASEQKGPNWELYAANTADLPGFPRSSGTLMSGRSPRITARVRGSHIWLRLQLADKTARWSFESCHLRVERMGMNRAVFQ